ncbi:hypothetical protein Tco_0364179 [Tanacetum coccineum]
MTSGCSSRREDGLKYRLKFALNKKELTLTLGDFRIIFQLPQATDNNHEHFVTTPKLSEMVLFYINDLGFTLELRSPSNFKTTDHAYVVLLFNIIHVDYTDLLWEGLHYSLEHPSTLNPYPRFTKLIVSHYMNAFHEISRSAHDKYHNLDDDMMVKNIFNSGKQKDGVGMKILSWMITDEMKLTKNYRLYAAVFGVDVPTTQSQTIESTQGTHRTNSSPRSPNSDTNEGESSAPRKSTKSHNELEAKHNVQKVKEHLIAEEIEKFVKRAENVENVEFDSYTLRQDDTQNVLGTRLEPRSNKESPEVEITAAEQLVNVIEEEEKAAEDDYELRIKGKREACRGELTVIDPPPSSSTPSSFSPKSKISATNRLLSLFKPKAERFKRYKSFFDELQGCYGYLFEHLKTRFIPRKNFNVLAQHLQEIMEELLPQMVDDRVKEHTKTQAPVYVA